MFRPKSIVLMVVALVLIAGVWAAASGTTIDQKAVLSGQVLSKGLTTPGADVCEGTVLVLVDTITGPAPAVRANADGKVKEVLVKPGDVIRSGDVVVRIEASRK